MEKLSDKKGQQGRRAGRGKVAEARKYFFCRGGFCSEGWDGKLLCRTSDHGCLFLITVYLIELEWREMSSESRISEF